MKTIKNLNIKTGVVVFIFSFLSFFLFLGLNISNAATLSFLPFSGTYATGSTITTDILISSSDRAAGSVSGLVSFPTNLLSILSISENGSVVDSWTQEPAYSNTSGSINFEGKFIDHGFKGNSSRVLTITFKVKSNAGPANINFIAGSVIAADDPSANILLSSSGAIFDISNTVKNNPVNSTEVTKTEKPVDKEVAISNPEIPVKIIKSEGWFSIAMTNISNWYFLMAGKVYYACYTVLRSVYNWYFSGLTIIYNWYSAGLVSLSNWYSMSLAIITSYVIVYKIKIIITALALSVLFLIWFVWFRFFRMESKLRKEVLEAESALHKAFNILKSSDKDQVKAFEKGKKGKRLNKGEEIATEQIEKDFRDAEKFIKKEIDDIEEVIDK